MKDKQYNFDLGIIRVAAWMTLFLTILKVTNVIDISVWWVLSPLFFTFGGILIIMCILFVLIIDNINTTDDEDESVNDE